MEVAAATRDRVAASLTKLRDLLGPTSVPAEVDTADTSALQQLVEDAFAELSTMVPDYSGPNATELVALALDLAEVRVALAGERTARRVNGAVQVQRALAHLRAIGSTEQMLIKAPEAVLHALWVQDGDSVARRRRCSDARTAYSAEDRHFFEKVQRFCGRLAPLQLDAMLLESDMLRRRGPLIVHDAMNDPRVIRELTRASNIHSYVAAPVMPEGRVIAFLHSSTLAVDDILDRDVIWAFAEGYGYALERTILLRRLQRAG